jgi:hypothetical protein
MVAALVALSASAPPPHSLPFCFDEEGHRRACCIHLTQYLRTERVKDNLLLTVPHSTLYLPSSRLSNARRSERSRQTPAVAWHADERESWPPRRRMARTRLQPAGLAASRRLVRNWHTFAPSSSSMTITSSRSSMQLPLLLLQEEE